MVASKEVWHLRALEDKYHLHLDKQAMDPPEDLKKAMEGELFDGLDLDSGDTVRTLYEKALELERRSYQLFKDRAERLPKGAEQTICEELAAEEAEHIAILESQIKRL